MSAHETPRSSGGMQTLGATQWIPSETSIQNLRNIKFWCVGEEALPPATPNNPYLEGSMQNQLIFLKNFSIFVICLKLHLKAKNTFGGGGGISWALRSVGGTPCGTDMDCIDKVKYSSAGNYLWRN